MRLLCLYGIGKKTETFGYLLPSSQALRTVADFHSRTFRDNTEWMLLKPVVFKQLTAIFFVPQVDLFASRLNCQLTPFVSWNPEPGAWAVNAFSICWTDLKFYASPPFSILGRVLAKVQLYVQEKEIHR